MQRPSFLVSEDPLDALCHHFNVAKAVCAMPMLPATFDMPVIRDAHMPTHVLAVMASDSTSVLMLPIDVNLYEQGFRVELNIPPAPPGTASPVPRMIGGTQTLAVTLPVVPVSVPHASSLPLLLLFGLGLETQSNLLASRLLPAQVVGEFPNAAAMAHMYSRFREDYFERYFQFTQGLWKNILALGLRHTKVVELVQTAWNVSAEARRLRQRSQQR